MCAQALLKGVELEVPVAGLAGCPIGEIGQRAGVEAVDAPLRSHRAGHQTGLAEHLEVFRRGGLTDPELRPCHLGELSRRSFTRVGEPLHNAAPNRVGHRLENIHLRTVVHGYIAIKRNKDESLDR
jgi:hypothetical protein